MRGGEKRKAHLNSGTERHSEAGTKQAEGLTDYNYNSNHL